MSTVDINSSVPISFVVKFDNTAFKLNFKSFNCPVKNVLERVVIATVLASKEIMETTEAKASWMKPALELSLFLKNENMVLRALWVEQASQLLRALLAFHTYKRKEGKVRELFLASSAKRTTLLVFSEVHGSSSGA